MRKSFLLLSLMLAACQPGRQASEPPARYQGAAFALAQFADTATVLRVCGGSAHEAGVMVEACVRNSVIIAPNPCQWPGSDTYAQLLCHEMGHVNGWPANHPTS